MAYDTTRSKTTSSLQDILLLIGRIAIGWIFVQSGWRKLMDMDAFIVTLTPRGVPADFATSWAGSERRSEFVGGVLI